jgi:hypothetical protein
MPVTPEYPLGRLESKDLTHLQTYALNLPVAVTNVEASLPLPSWHASWDQGRQGACVGYGSSMMMSVRNNLSSSAEGDHRYHPEWLWTQAKAVDGFTHTNPNDGTTVHAAAQILNKKGHVKVVGGKDQPVNLHEGIAAYRWANSLDDVRGAIALQLPVSIGINWYSSFDSPVSVRSGLTEEYWIGKGSLGSIRGGHCVCLYGASDKRQAVAIKNSWGSSYPLVWMPYSVVSRLISENGEFVVITDR